MSSIIQIQYYLIYSMNDFLCKSVQYSGSRKGWPRKRKSVVLTSWWISACASDICRRTRCQFRWDRNRNRSICQTHSRIQRRRRVAIATASTTDRLSSSRLGAATFLTSKYWHVFLQHWREVYCTLLWPPYVTGGPLSVVSIFYLLLSFFPRLISAAACWMSTILLHMAWF